ncbi:signal peptidase II [Alkalibacter rhizosphaerae]|uniref:Lipoprotein signal peptidase n=1 Tax=Alkalibacter rhizosphaerae TaxID=2815577 RepID=A0A974XLA4_9FIRM|nr:signal peptidase II [Alkalibacter rhizosphaerae]QSX08056.1 signal peptidase II [Alkalibacter rhizosphaerae]
MAKLVLYILVFLTCFFLDLLMKHLANDRLALRHPVQVYKRLYLVLVHNKGAAYGLLKNRKRLLRILSAFAMFFMVYLFIYTYNNDFSPEFMISLSVVLAGAAGNFSERIRHGYVTDFLYIKVKKMPIFNLADLFIVIGMVFVYYHGLF